MTSPSESEVVGVRFDKITVDMLDDVRVKLSQGTVQSRSSVVKQAVYFYLGYLGYNAPRPETGGRKKNGGKKR